MATIYEVVCLPLVATPLILPAKRYTLSLELDDTGTARQYNSAVLYTP